MAAQKKYLIRGTISNSKGQPLQGLTIRAFDKDAWGENSLGKSSITDEKGNYLITYLDREFRLSPSESGGADIIIRVYDEKLVVSLSRSWIFFE